MADSDQRDGGFATVWAAGAVAAMLVLTTLVVWLGSATLTRHRAAAAADLAALAVAGRAVSGDPNACRAAIDVVDRMGGRVDSCRLRGWDALVEVSMPSRLPITEIGQGTARARAGPVDAHVRRSGVETG